MRVAVGASGNCPSCNRDLTALVARLVVGNADETQTELPQAGRDASSGRLTVTTSSTPADAGKQPTVVTWSELIDELCQDLLAGKLPRACCLCGKHTKSVIRQFHVETSDFGVVLPASVCGNCTRRAPFNETQVSTSVIGLIALACVIGLAVAEQLVLAIVAASAWAVFSLLTQERRFDSRETPQRLLRRGVAAIPIYGRLFQRYPLAVVIPIRAADIAQHDYAALSEHVRQTVAPRVHYRFFSSSADLQTSRVPPVILRSMFQLIDQEILKLAHQHPKLSGHVVQVACAMLAGRRNAFEIQGLPRELIPKLATTLDDLPCWSTAVPITFAVLRKIQGQPDGIRPELQAPFQLWAKQLGVAEELSVGEIVRRYHRLEPGAVNPEFRADDVQAFLDRLPELTGLAILHAELLQHFDRAAEAVPVYDRLIEAAPEEAYLRYLRARCLSAAGLWERAAAECQAVLKDSPADGDTRALLARLQLQLSRPADAVATATQGLLLEEQAELYLVRALANFELEKFDQSVSDVNVALFADANLAEAYLLRARLRLGFGNFAGAVEDVGYLHRMWGISNASVYVRTVALRAMGETSRAIELVDEVLQAAPQEPFLLGLRADLLADTGKYELALVDCDAVIAEHPSFVTPYLTRAAIHLECDRPRDAIEDVERTISLGGESARGYMLRGLAKDACGETEEGILDLTQAVELDQENSVVYFHRARLRVKSNDYESAIEDYSAALRLNPEWSDALVQRGYLYLYQDEIAAATEDFEAAIAHAPRWAEALRARAALYVQTDRKSEALNDLNQALELEPDNVGCRLMRAEVLLSQRDQADAKSDLNEALHLVPDFVPALFQRAHLHLSLGDHEAARKDFDAILKHDPESTSALIGRSVAHEQKGDVDQSAKDAEEARQTAPLDSENLEIKRLLLNAMTAFNNEQYDKAVEYASQAIELQADCWPAYRLRGVAYWYDEQFVDAIDEFTATLEFEDAPEQELLSARGQVLAELQEYQRAYKDLTRAVELGRQQGGDKLAFSLNGLGLTLVGLERIDDARRAFDESLQLQADNAWLHYNLGLLHMAEHETPEAVSCFERALEAKKPALTPRKRLRVAGTLERLRGTNRST